MKWAILSQQTILLLPIYIFGGGGIAMHLVCVFLVFHPPKKKHFAFSHKESTRDHNMLTARLAFRWRMGTRVQCILLRCKGPSEKEI
jgi:hypothetical protein